ncbi:MAG TPA: FAD-dependent oxidoreductase [Chloroflexota bacterium]|jgi:sulfide:quinone oxidoreductase|nr:FAD-dependent oxidoreductase [Chloroflexota bacterium]
MSSRQAGQATGNIVIAGAGFAGLGAAFTLRRLMGPAHKITVVDPRSRFVFAPSLLAAALGRPAFQAGFELEPVLRAHGIDFVRSALRSVDVANQTVMTDAGPLAFNRLLIATGGTPDPDAVPGVAGEWRQSSFIVGVDSAQDVWTRLRRIPEHAKSVIVGIAPGGTYVSAMYELVLGIEALLRNRGMRDAARLTFVTPEPYLGHLGFGQSAARAPLETMFARRGIEVMTGASISQVRAGEVILDSGDSIEAGEIFLMPPFSGAVDVWKSAGITNERGLVPVNGAYRHPEHDAIYAAGVASIFDGLVRPLVERQAPHTGYLSLRMGKTAGQNIAASLGVGSQATYTLPRTLDLRVLDGASEGFLLASHGRDKLQHRAIRLPGPSARYLKKAIEQYQLWRLKSGHP